METKTNWFDLKTILIIVLIAIVILMKMCASSSSPDKGVDKIKVNGKSYEVLKIIHDTQTVKRDTIVYRNGKDIYHDTTIYVNVPGHIDTASVIKNYFAKSVYLDTLELPRDLGYIYVRDTLFKNSIFARKWQADIDERVDSTTIIVKEPSTWQIYYGLTIGADKNLLNYAGPSLLYKSKKDDIYSISAGYSINRSLSVQGSIFWKIRLKKNTK